MMSRRGGNLDGGLMSMVDMMFGGTAIGTALVLIFALARAITLQPHEAGAVELRVFSRGEIVEIACLAKVRNETWDSIKEPERTQEVLFQPGVGREMLVRIRGSFSDSDRIALFCQRPASEHVVLPTDVRTAEIAIETLDGRFFGGGTVKLGPTNQIIEIRIKDLVHFATESSSASTLHQSAVRGEWLTQTVSLLASRSELRREPLTSDPYLPAGGRGEAQRGGDWSVSGGLGAWFGYSRDESDLNPRLRLQLPTDATSLSASKLGYVAVDGGTVGWHKNEQQLTGLLNLVERATTKVIESPESVNLIGEAEQGYTQHVWHYRSAQFAAVAVPELASRRSLDTLGLWKIREKGWESVNLAIEPMLSEELVLLLEEWLRTIGSAEALLRPVAAGSRGFVMCDGDSYWFRRRKVGGWVNLGRFPVMCSTPAWAWRDSATFGVSAKGYRSGDLLPIGYVFGMWLSSDDAWSAMGIRQDPLFWLAACVTKG